MTNRLFAMLRYAAALAFVAGLLIVSSCDEDEPTGPTMNIKDLIASETYKQSATVPAEQALDTLSYYLNLYPELVAFMTSASPEYTLFAPSNAAFASLKATPGFPTAPNAIKLINPELIKGVLSFHFVEGKKMKADLTSGTVLSSKFTDPLAPGAAQTITVNADGTLKAAPNATNTAIDIVKADGEATNGVVHVTESVMIPTSTGAVLIPILGKVAGTVLLSKDFTNLAKVIQAADQGFTENPSTGTFKVSTWLAMPITAAGAVTANQKGITFFAPPNTAGTTPIFTEAAANAIIATADKGRAFLLNHLVTVTANQTVGQYTVADAPANNPNGITKFALGQSINPYNGATKRIFVNVGTASATNPYGVAISNDVSATPPPAASFKPILLKDVAASNGYLQAIGGVLN
jgi:uncharacterized surface protein with fasciclin (FAS1) repeats